MSGTWSYVSKATAAYAGLHLLGENAITKERIELRQRQICHIQKMTAGLTKQQQLF